jgi:hypothetical protein
MGGNMEPITKFENLQQRIDSLNEWKMQLGLHDWTIKVKMVEPHEFELDDCDGECEYTKINKSATIRILKPQYYGDRIQKYCAERILVHELLHCKFALLDTNSDGFNTLIHQMQEDIAKAFLCAKYNINRDWFDNIHYEEDET